MSRLEPAHIEILIDGRRERGARNKNAVVSALLQLYETGEIQPAAARIAEIAGVSERSVFRYFDDMEDLATSAISMQWERVRKIFETLNSDGTFDQRLKAIIEHRLRLHDKVALTYAAALIASVRSVAVTKALEGRRGFLRAQTLQQFGPELASSADIGTVTHVVDYTLSLENIHYLRNSVGLSPTKIRETLEVAITKIFRN